ncbi:MAG: DUF1848 domain-containing protein [bacterium]
MIISASRRTDIPSFYAEWFINRIRAGYCCVANPFNPSYIKFVSLKPEDVDVIVFWTKNAKPLIPFLNMLDEMGYKYYFQYTLTGYPKIFEPNTPSQNESLQIIQTLADKIGKARIIWRYDPIIFSNVTSFFYHADKFSELVEALKNFTRRVMVSIFDEYKAAKNRMMELKKVGVEQISDPQNTDEFGNLFQTMASIARSADLEIFSCAEEIDISRYGIPPGKCIDNEYIKDVFGLDVCAHKDKSQRTECLCVESKDIGFYDTCLHGCEYCYATSNKEAVTRNVKTHRDDSPSLIGWYDEDFLELGSNIQMKLFNC